MKTKTKLSSLAIGAKIRAGKNFRVGTNLERKAAISAARFAGVKIVTRAVVFGNGFTIHFPEANRI